LAVSGQDTASGLAISSLVLGILSLTGLTCLTGIPAIICGHMAQSRRKQAGVGGSGIAVAGLVTGYAGTVLITLVFVIGLLSAVTVPAFMRARQKAQLTQSVARVKQITNACNMYQAVHGEYPPSLNALVDGDISLADVLSDPLSPGKTGSEAYWYSKPSRTAPGDTVIVASYGETSDGQRALGHKDGSVSTGPFTIPQQHLGAPLEPLTVPPRR
jgi:type II secretory pathway pseudopilin PulG